MAEDEAAVQLQAVLAAREAAASQRITVLFGASLEDRAGFNAQVTAVREDLAALRAATRDLEVLTEEEDTCATLCPPRANSGCRLLCRAEAFVRTDAGIASLNPFLQRGGGTTSGGRAEGTPSRV